MPCVLSLLGIFSLDMDVCFLIDDAESWSFTDWRSQCCSSDTVANIFDPKLHNVDGRVALHCMPRVSTESKSRPTSFKQRYESALSVLLVCTRENWCFDITHPKVFDGIVIWLVVSNISYFHPCLGKRSNLTNIFQIGWNHQLGYYKSMCFISWNYLQKVQGSLSNLGMGVCFNRLVSLLNSYIEVPNMGNFFTFL